VMCGNGNQM